MGNAAEYKASCFMTLFLKRINAFIISNFDHFCRGHREKGVFIKLRNKFSNRMIEVRIISEIILKE